MGGEPRRFKGGSRSPAGDTWDDDADLSLQGKRRVHPFTGGESQQELMRQEVIDADHALLRQTLNWQNIAPPAPEQLVYARSAMNSYKLACRRVHALQQRLARGEEIQIPVLTFVALMKDKGEMVQATRARKDVAVNLF